MYKGHVLLKPGSQDPESCEVKGSKAEAGDI